MKFVLHLFIFFLLFPCCSSNVFSAEDASPDTHYMGRKIATTMHWKAADWLIRHERELEESAEEMIRALNLKPGMTVGDLGCGNGYHALKMARLVAPDGIIYGVDIQEKMLTFLRQRAEKKGIDNIKPVLGTLTDPRLPENSMDLILVVDAYHEFSHPEKMLAGIRRSLKPDGFLVLLEYRLEDDSVPIKPDHKMSKEQIDKELSANGFRLVKSYDKLPWQHMVFYEKQ